MASDWVKIFTTSNPMEAQIVLSMLKEHGIDAVEMNKRDSSYQAFGYIDLYCNHVDAMEALVLINKNNNSK